MGIQRAELLAGVDQVPGWLARPAALTTIELLDWQASMNFKGGILEIGVFCGKYFSILLNGAMQTGEKILGIDTFEFTDIERVEREMEGIFGSACLGSFSLWKGRSDSFAEMDIFSEIGPSRFISVDGSHEAACVYLDLVLAEGLAGNYCIVAVDDFLNPLTLGVNQAVNMFFSQPRKLVPVAYTSNKLFLSHRVSAVAVLREIERIFGGGGDQFSEDFNMRLSRGRHHVEQVFHGFPIVIG